MMTLFSIPKPFHGHIGAIQRNAIISWTRLQPRPEILLFGSEAGTAEIVQELGLRHIPTVACSEYGTPLVSNIFETAQTSATYDILCYANADIIFFADFMRAVQEVCAWRDSFLMVGQRSNVDLDEFEKYDGAGQEALLRNLVSIQKPPTLLWAIDYFVFPRGLFNSIPRFAIGRCAWDNWLLWKARASSVAVVDVSCAVLAVHQNHDYSHLTPDGWQGVSCSPETIRNRELASGNLCSLEDATHRLTRYGIRSNLSTRLLKITRPLRHRIGLRRATIEALMVKLNFLPRTRRKTGYNALRWL